MISERKQFIEEVLRMILKSNGTVDDKVIQIMTFYRTLVETSHSDTPAPTKRVGDTAKRVYGAS